MLLDSRFRGNDTFIKEPEDALLSERRILGGIGKSIRKANSESGRSMVEILGVLVIIATLSIGALIGYQRMLTQHKINQLGALLMQRGTLSMTYFMTHDTDLYQDKSGANRRKVSFCRAYGIFSNTFRLT